MSFHGIRSLVPIHCKINFSLRKVTSPLEILKVSRYFMGVRIPPFFLFSFFLFLFPVPFFGIFTQSAGAAVETFSSVRKTKPSPRRFSHLKKDIRSSVKKPRKPLRKVYASPVFDFPIIYNYKVKSWIKYFQTKGRGSFKRWLERSTRYAPYIKKELKNHNLPGDIFYVAMIESGFASKARSSAGAVGLWQFIPSTGREYGLKINGWGGRTTKLYQGHSSSYCL